MITITYTDNHDKHTLHTEDPYAANSWLSQRAPHFTDIHSCDLSSVSRSDTLFEALQDAVYDSTTEWIGVYLGTTVEIRQTANT